MSFKDELKESLTIEQHMSLLTELAAEPRQIDDVTFICRTVCHNPLGEGSHKLYFYLNQGQGGLYRCYTGCSTSFDIFELIQRIMKIRTGMDWTLPQAINYVASFFGIVTRYQEIEYESAEIKNDWDILKRYQSNKKPKEQIIQYKHYDNKILKNLPHPRIGVWEAEGITKEVIKNDNIAYDPISASIIIPHYDEDNNLIGIRRRTLIKDEEKYGKYTPARFGDTMYNHSLAFNLYNLNNSKGNIKRLGKAVIFESEKATMMYASAFGIENDISVAVCGSSLSKYQVERLIAAGASEIIIAFDRCGEHDNLNQYVKKFYEMNRKYSPMVNLSFIYDNEAKYLNWKDSPIDKGRYVFEELFKKRIYL